MVGRNFTRRVVRQTFRRNELGGCSKSFSALPPLARPPHISKGSTPQELEAYVARAGFESRRTQEGELCVTLTARKPVS